LPREADVEEEWSMRETVRSGALLVLGALLALTLLTPAFG
jgi:hypothetical protein